jgi:hypothetical protein
MSTSEPSSEPEAANVAFSALLAAADGDTDRLLDLLTDITESRHRMFCAAVMYATAIKECGLLPQPQPGQTVTFEIQQLDDTQQPVAGPKQMLLMGTLTAVANSDAQAAVDLWASPSLVVCMDALSVLVVAAGRALRLHGDVEEWQRTMDALGGER